MNCIGNPVGTALPDVVGDNNIGADGQAHEKIYEQVNNGSVASYSGQGLASCAVAQDSNIRGIKKLLHRTGSSQRQCEEEHPFRKRSV